MSVWFVTKTKKPIVPISMPVSVAITLLFRKIVKKGIRIANV